MPQPTTFPDTTRLIGHKGPVYALSSDPVPGLFHSASGDGSVARWDIHAPLGHAIYVIQVDNLHALKFIPAP